MPRPIPRQDSSAFHGIQMLGVINALNTGNPVIDSIIAMCLPFLLTLLINHLSSKESRLWWSSLRLFDRRAYKRRISYQSTDDGGSNNNSSAASSAGGFHEDSYNVYLIKAIKLYIHENCNLSLDEVDLELTAGTKASADGEKSHADTHVQKALRQLGVASNATSTYSMLQKCNIIQKPIPNKWHNIGTFDGAPVYIHISESSSIESQSSNSDGTQSSATSVHSVELRFESKGKGSIDCFVDMAHQWYMRELKRQENEDRFLYDLRGFDGRGNNKHPTYSAYKLGDGKTFDSLFSQQCHDLLEIVDSFQEKTGKYAIKGYPHKLGLLLHGPPGTGKTSLIKALAHYTKRNIVNVPLSRVATNQDLTSVFFSQRINVSGSPKSIQLGYDQVIFVMEDIDSASDVVLRRDATNGTADEPNPQEQSPERQPKFRVAEAEHEFHSRRPKSRESGEGPEPRRHRRSKLRDAQESPESRNRPMTAATTPTLIAVEDELNLSGMLNVLDGIVETPGRIVIMTSNHPEALDPALIRPGRISKKLELSYMTANDTMAMLEHYYQTKLSESEKDRVRLAVNGVDSDAALTLIPALVEQQTMEEETLDSMIAWIEAKRSSIAIGSL